MSSAPERAQREAAIVDAVVRTFASAILYSHEVAEKLGLGATDSQFLTLLQVHGPLTPGRLAALSGLTTGTVTGVLDRLERAGYVRRDRATHDRRKVIVSRVEDQIMNEIGPMYAGKATGLLDLLAGYDDSQLAVVADFAARLADS